MQTHHGTYLLNTSGRTPTSLGTYALGAHTMAFTLLINPLNALPQKLRQSFLKPSNRNIIKGGHIVAYV